MASGQGCFQLLGAAFSRSRTASTASLACSAGKNNTYQISVLAVDSNDLRYFIVLELQQGR